MLPTSLFWDQKKIALAYAKSVHAAKVALNLGAWWASADKNCVIKDDAQKFI